MQSGEEASLHTEKIHLSFLSLLSLGFLFTLALGFATAVILIRLFLVFKQRHLREHELDVEAAFEVAISARVVLLRVELSRTQHVFEAASSGLLELSD